MFESILIANRGEIACRIIRTCRRLGIRSIAVYSDADASARHVREADAAVRIGPAEAVRSYLDAEAIVRAAIATGASAVHPGYGFLSESTQLVSRCAEHGIGWIGPNARVIELMGSKIESKRIALHAGVPCVPGYQGEDQSNERLRAEAAKIGAPILIKASAGGGGKGMRRVDDLAAFDAQLDIARREAQRAFGDDRILIEKLIQRPRHLEVQLAGDRHGGLVHVFERECSVQRNYQKVLEEAPAPRLSDAVRERLYDAALRLGREIGYDSLGTVEFVLEDGAEQPYFLEMNTRLQVEHPVTEQVTGLDLVEWQIRIAAGETLPLPQEQIQRSGWAIEARINCEDPAHQYRPEFGTVRGYVEPAVAGVRCDSGIHAGSQVAPHYDSMVAKVIGHGATRAQAIDRLREGLLAFEAAGIGTNQGLLLAIVEHSRFRAGELTTGFLPEVFPQGWPGDVQAQRLVRAAAALWTVLRAGASGYWQRQGGYRFMAASGRQAVARLRIALDNDEQAVALQREGEGWRIEDGAGSPWSCRVVRDGPGRLRLAPAQGAPRSFTLLAEGDDLIVASQGTRWRLRVLSELEALARAAGAAGAAGNEICAELPGAVTEIHVQPGDVVAEGQVLVVMESMKLIFPLAAPRAGTVAAVRCTTGEVVARGHTLLQLAPLETAGA